MELEFFVMMEPPVINGGMGPLYTALMWIPEVTPRKRWHEFKQAVICSTFGGMWSLVFCIMNCDHPFVTKHLNQWRAECTSSESESPC